MDQPTARLQRAAPSFLSASALVFVSSTIVNLGNYAFNIVFGRWLGPAAFADLSIVVTLFLLVTLATATLQTLAAKFAAVSTAGGDHGHVATVRSWLLRQAWIWGVVLFACMSLAAPLLQQFFHTQSAALFVILGASIPLYFAQGVERGVLQGQTRFGLLAGSYQVEMWVRLASAVALVALGWAVYGAAASLPLSVLATWLVARRAAVGLPAHTSLTPAERSALARFAGPVALALLGQILINNSDVLIVKHFFPSAAAGQYAALALIGRIVFFATYSVVVTLFPIVAQKQARGEPHRHLLWAGIGVVVGVSLPIVAGTAIVPELVVRLLFGAEYLPVAPLLLLYAVVTVLFAVANVLINYRLSLGNGGGSLLAALAGVAQVAGLWLLHGSLAQVVLVQLAVMGALVGLLIAWDIGLSVRSRRSVATAALS